MIGEEEEITLRHRAFSRSLFASGAITLARWLLMRTNAGLYHLLDIKPEELAALLGR